MLSLLKHLLIPSRSDRLLAAWALLYAAAAVPIVLVYILGPFREFRDMYVAFLPHFAVGGAVFGGIGLWRWDVLRRRWLLVVAALASLCVFPVLGRLIHLDLSSNYYNMGMRDVESEATVWNAVQILVLWCVASFAVTRAANWVTTIVALKLSRLKVARTRMLLGAALVLFGLSMLTRSGTGHSVLSDLVRGAFFRHSIISAIAFSLISISVTMILVMRLRRAWVAIFLGACYLGILAWSISIALIATGTTLDGDTGLAIASYLILLAMTALLMREPTVVTGNDLLDAKNPGESASATGPRSQFAPSLWGVTIVAITGLFIFGAVRYDPIAWSRAPEGKRWEYARLSRQFQTLPGTTGFVSFEQSGWFGGPTQSLFQVELQLSEKTPADALSRLRIPDEIQMWLSIRDIRPDIDLSPLRDIKRIVFVNSGTISPDQFVDLMSGGKVFTDQLTQIEVVDQPATKTTRDVGNVYFQQLGAGNIAKLFKTMEPSDSTAILRLLNCELNLDDWTEILRVAQFHHVTVEESELTDEVLALLEAQPENMLVVSNRYLSTNDPKFWKLILDSSVGIWFYWSPLNDPRRGGLIEDSEELNRRWQQYWDAIFASRGYSRFNANALATLSPFDNTKLEAFRQRCIDWHLCFDPPEARSPDNIRHLYIPPDHVPALARAGLIPELEVLSLDHEWLPALSNRAVVGAGFRGAVNVHEPVDLGFLSKTAKLEELYVGMNQAVLNFDFLANVPKLRHLQVAAFDNAFQSLNVKNAPQLESVVLFAEPDFRMIRKLLSLPKLKRLIIVYSDDESKVDLNMEKVNSLVPEGVEFRIMKRDEYETQVPELFRQHLERVREEARKKYLGDGPDKAAETTPSNDIP